MKRRSALSALAALGLATASGAMAQGGSQQPNRAGPHDPGPPGARPAAPPGPGPRGNPPNRPDVRRDDRYGPADARRGDPRPDLRRDDRYRSDGPGRSGGRGAGPDHSLRPGGRLPPVYRTRHYVVDDWRAHRLTPPPRGYHWVQVGADYVLVAIATGIILQMILGY